MYFFWVFFFRCLLLMIFCLNEIKVRYHHFTLRIYQVTNGISTMVYKIYPLLYAYLNRRQRNHPHNPCSRGKRKARDWSWGIRTQRIRRLPPTGLGEPLATQRTQGWWMNSYSGQLWGEIQRKIRRGIIIYRSL